MGFIIAYSVILVFGGVCAAAVRAEEPLSYNKDVRPILAANCFACYGPDSASLKADLRLDQKSAAEGMGAILPGNPEESAIIQRILATDPEEVMPPPATKKTLTPAQIETLKK